MAFFLAFIPLLIKAVATCACAGGVCYCAKKAHDAYKHGQKTKRLKYEYTLEEKKAAREKNEQLQPKREETQKKQEANQTKIQELEKKSEEAHRNSKNSNLSDDERAFYRSKAREYDDEVKRLKQENQKYHNEIKDLDSQIKNNDKIISSMNSGDLDDRHWIWQFLTLENILIMLAIYALWKIVRDEQHS